MKYLTNSGLSYFFNKIKAYLTSSTYLNSIGISNSEIDDIADDAGYSSGSLPASEDIFITGDIIPNTDNSVDLGASSKNIKMIYTKGITINGTQFLPSDYIPLSGTTSITGTAFFKSTSDSQLQIGSGTSATTGGCFIAYGSEHSNSELAGSFRLRARTTSNYDLQGLADGKLKWSGNVFYVGSSYIYHSASEKDTEIGTGYHQGAQLYLFDKTSARPNTGIFILRAYDDTNGEKNLIGSPDGYLGWNGKNVAMYEDVIPRSGGVVMTGRSLGRVDNTGNLNICGGTIWSDGGFVALRGKNTDLPNQAGTAVIGAANSDTDFRSMTLKPDGTWTWDGNAVQLVSDQRLKQQISEIDDVLLDAWEDVTLCQFKYNDAVDTKKDKARLHTGYVVQQIDNACKSHNVDVSQYGLYCHEEYPEETEEVEVEQEDGTIKKETKVIREASEHYSLRYTEVYAVECMYLRRENSRLKEKLASLEERLEKLENSEK